MTITCVAGQQGQHQHHGDGGRGPGQQTRLHLRHLRGQDRPAAPGPGQVSHEDGVKRSLGPGPGHQQAQSLQCRLRQDWLRLEDEVKGRTESGLGKPSAFE